MKIKNQYIKNLKKEDVSYYEYPIKYELKAYEDVLDKIRSKAQKAEETPIEQPVIEAKEIIEPEPIKIEPKSTVKPPLTRSVMVPVIIVCASNVFSNWVQARARTAFSWDKRVSP